MPEPEGLIVTSFAAESESLPLRSSVSETSGVSPLPTSEGFPVSQRLSSIMGNEIGSRRRPARLALPGPTQFGSGAASSSQQMPQTVSAPAQFVSYAPPPVEFVVPGGYISTPSAPVIEEIVTPGVAQATAGIPEGQEGPEVPGSDGPLSAVVEPVAAGRYQLSRPQGQGLMDNNFDARVMQAQSNSSFPPL